MPRRYATLARARARARSLRGCLLLQRIDRDVAGGWWLVAGGATSRFEALPLAHRLLLVAGLYRLAFLDCLPFGGDLKLDVAGYLGRSVQEQGGHRLVYRELCLVRGPPQVHHV